ncbi:MAG: hypothetical protein JSS66_06840 [Armatimonadetes bacterium]|nr:hypothetical protein [Armatimonadota bacterium]
MQDTKKTWLLEVTDIDGDTIWGLLSEPEDPSGRPVEEVQIETARLGYDGEMQPGLVFWWHIDGDKGTNTFELHEACTRKWTQEDVDRIKVEARRMFKIFCAPSERLTAWVEEHCTPEGAEFMESMGLTNPQRSFAMLRHQVRDVAEHAGVTTAQLAEYYRIALETEFAAPESLYVPNMALQHLTNMNPYGINQKGEVPLAQHGDDEDPEYVEWVYVADLLPPNQ